MTFRYSVNFYPSLLTSSGSSSGSLHHNYIDALPTMNGISADGDFKLEKIDTDEALLFLHNLKPKRQQ